MSHYYVPVAIIHLIGMNVKENKCHETMLAFVSSSRMSSPSFSGGVGATAGGEEENKALIINPHILVLYSPVWPSPAPFTSMMLNGAVCGT